MTDLESEVLMISHLGSGKTGDPNQLAEMVKDGFVSQEAVNMFISNKNLDEGSLSAINTCHEL